MLKKCNLCSGCPTEMNGGGGDRRPIVARLKRICICVTTSARHYCSGWRDLVIETNQMACVSKRDSFMLGERIDKDRAPTTKATRRK